MNISSSHDLNGGRGRGGRKRGKSGMGSLKKKNVLTSEQKGIYIPLSNWRKIYQMYSFLLKAKCIQFDSYSINIFLLNYFAQPVPSVCICTLFEKDVADKQRYILINTIHILNT